MVAEWRELAVDSRGFIGGSPIDLSESTAMMPMTRSPMRREASSATSAPIEWPTSTI